MVNPKFHPARRKRFFRDEGIHQCVEILKNSDDASGQTLHDAMTLQNFAQTTQLLTHSLDSFSYSGVIKSDAHPHKRGEQT